MGQRHLPYRPLHTQPLTYVQLIWIYFLNLMLHPVRWKKKKKREKHGISRPQFLVSLHITDNLGMLQNISSLKYFHGSNRELKQMGFQHDLSTYQTLLTQIIVQQSCCWIHVTFWEKHQGYSENGYAAQRQLGWQLREPRDGNGVSVPLPVQVSLHHSSCLEGGSALCHKMLGK